MNKVKEFIKDNGILVIATSYRGKPRATALEYGVVNDSIIIGTFKDSIKVRNIESNKNISISINNMPKFITIDGYIKEASKNEEEEYKKEVLKKHPEFKELMENGPMKDNVYYKIVMKKVYYNDYSKGMAPTEIIKY